MACRRRCEPRHVETKGNAHYFIHTTNQMATPFTCLTSISFLFQHFYHFLQLQLITHNTTKHILFTTLPFTITSYLCLSHNTLTSQHAIFLKQTLSSSSSSPSPSSSSFPFSHIINSITWLFCYKTASNNHGRV